MKIIGKKLSLKEFDDYVKTKDFGEVPPSFIVLHHTWNPTKENWVGKKSIDGLKRYYESKGWSAGPHLFIAEDGIWLFTDMYEVGIHAGAGNGSVKNGYSIGVEVVGNYDDQVWSGETYINTVGAMKILKEVLKITDGEVKFHRDFSSKTCPGRAITKEWVINQLNNKMKKKNQEFYDDKLQTQGWSTLENWVEGAREYKEERDEERDKVKKLERLLQGAEDESKKLMEKIQGLVKNEEKIKDQHRLELSREKEKITKEFNNQLGKLQQKLAVCEKIKEGAMDLIDENDCKDTIKRLEDIIEERETEINNLDLEIAKLKKHDVREVFKRIKDKILSYFK